MRCMAMSTVRPPASRLSQMWPGVACKANIEGMESRHTDQRHDAWPHRCPEDEKLLHRSQAEAAALLLPSWASRATIARNMAAVPCTAAQHGSTDMLLLVSYWLGLLCPELASWYCGPTFSAGTSLQGSLQAVSAAASRSGSAQLRRHLRLLSCPGALPLLAPAPLCCDASSITGLSAALCMLRFALQTCSSSISNAGATICGCVCQRPGVAIIKVACQASCYLRRPLCCCLGLKAKLV
jgi:hypothetical protein